MRRARLSDLSAEQLFWIYRLRVDVFVVEQECVYPEIDDDDLVADHLWVDEIDGPGVAAYLRVIDDGHQRRIGRVVTAQSARGQGLAAQLIGEVLETTQGPWVLEAQTYLRRFYEGLGFEVTGSEYVEDGIAHLPMQRL
ncbi:MAG: ElaA protein [Candidatus Poriferisodalaceae bacterium]|jgi:ElaA protein